MTALRIREKPSAHKISRPIRQGNPAAMARRFRCWQVAMQHGCDLTVGELAEKVGLPMETVRSYARNSNWGAALRASPGSAEYHPDLRDGADL